MTPHWLMPVIHCQSSRGISPTKPPTATPALLMRRSTPGSHSLASACRRFMSSSLETSQRSVRTVPPRFDHLRRLGEAGLVDVAEQQARATVGELAGERPTEPGGRAGQDTGRGAREHGGIVADAGSPGNRI